MQGVSIFVAFLSCAIILGRKHARLNFFFIHSYNCLLCFFFPFPFPFLLFLGFLHWIVGLGMKLKSSSSSLSLSKPCFHYVTVGCMNSGSPLRSIQSQRHRVEIKPIKKLGRKVEVQSTNSIPKPLVGAANHCATCTVII